MELGWYESIFAKMLSYPQLLYYLESSARIFARLQGVVEMVRFYLVDTLEYIINLQWRRKSL